MLADGRPSVGMSGDVHAVQDKLTGAMAGMAHGLAGVDRRPMRSAPSAGRRGQTLVTFAEWRARRADRMTAVLSAHHGWRHCRRFCIAVVSHDMAPVSLIYLWSFNFNLLFCAFKTT